MTRRLDIKYVIFSAIIITLIVFDQPMAKDLLLMGDGSYDQYLCTISGTVLNEKHDNANVLLTLSPISKTLATDNPYLLIAEGYPKTNTRNSFFWNSTFSQMTLYQGQLTCTIKETTCQVPDIHFFYMSPILLKIKGFSTQRDKENVAKAEKRALPTKVFAQAGELKLTIGGGLVSGTVWLKGYDSIEHAYVLYNATIHGQKTSGLTLERRVR